MSERVEWTRDHMCVGTETRYYAKVGNRTLEVFRGAGKSTWLLSGTCRGADAYGEATWIAEALARIEAGQCKP